MLSNILDGAEVVLTGITHRIVSSSRSRCNVFLPPLHNRNILDFFKIRSRSRCSFFPPQCNFFLHCAAFFNSSSWDWNWISNLDAKNGRLPPQCNFFPPLCSLFPFKQRGGWNWISNLDAKNGPLFCFWTQSILSTFSTAVLHPSKFLFFLYRPGLMLVHFHILHFQRLHDQLHISQSLNFWQSISWCSCARSRKVLQELMQWSQHIPAGLLFFSSSLGCHGHCSQFPLL